MKAKFTINGEIIEQTIGELTAGLEDEGYEMMEYLRDCYISDESGFEGSFSEWLDRMYA